MGRTSPSRWLAPLALLVVAVLVVVILASSGGSGGGPAATPALDRDLPQTTEATTTTTTTPKTTGSGAETYTVESGDTLSAISVETQVPVTTLQELNPDIDVQALQPGQVLKLR